MMKSRWIPCLVVVSSFLLLSASAWAQSSITGVVRDTSGAVLPGVTVEAASPALIEKVRSTVTDDQGRYRIVDLRPGTYTVTFALTGFSTSKREGLELRAEFTATVNADLAVGTLEETITVSGDAPTVDLRSSRAQVQFAQETLQSLPGTGGSPPFPPSSRASRCGARATAASADSATGHRRPTVSTALRRRSLSSMA
jgi:hypothetical protein